MEKYRKDLDYDSKLLIELGIDKIGCVDEKWTSDSGWRCEYSIKARNRSLIRDIINKCMEADISNQNINSAKLLIAAENVSNSTLLNLGENISSLINAIEEFKNQIQFINKENGKSN